MLALTVAAVLVTYDPWVGCEIHGPSAGIELRAQCDRAWVSVTVDKPAEAGQAAMLEVVDELTLDDRPVSSGGSIKELKVGSRKFPGRVYRPKDTWGYVVLLPAGEGRVRMAQCEEKREGRCSKLFEALVTKLPPATVKSIENPLRFGDGVIAVPAQCRGPVHARVECGSTALTWSHFPLGDEDVFEVSVNALEAGLGRLGKVFRTSVDCTVAGAPTTCALLTITKPDGKDVFTLFGVGKTATEQVAAQCNTASGFGMKLAAPCDQAMTIRK